MSSLFGRDFAGRLQALKDGLLPYLKERIRLLEESPAGEEISPEPDSPRAYTPGDDIRYIDWSLYARLDKLYLKTMTREEEVPALFLLDTSGSMGTPESGKFVTALRVTAALTDIFLTLGHRVLIMPWSEGVEGVHGPFRGENALGSVLQVLETIRADGTSDLKRSLREAAPGEGGASTYPVIISDFLFPMNYRDELGLFATGPMPMGSLQILSPAENSFRLRGNLILTDPETGREEALNAGYRTSRIFQETFRRHLEGVEGLFREKGAVFRRAISSDPFESSVKSLVS